jgi:type II secretory pathway component GspD/PulD (secretin)
MRRLGLALVPLVATVALAQQAPAPPVAAAPAPAPAQAPMKPADLPKPVEFLDNGGIRRPDGMVVHFYKVNYVDASRLVDELKKWASSPKTTITVEQPITTQVTPKPPAPTVSAHIVVNVQNTLRIEETEENWPTLRHVLDLIDVPQLQVVVEAKIVEISYNDDLRIGVNSTYTRTLGDTFFKSATMSFPNRIDPANGFTSAFHHATDSYSFEYVLDLSEAGAKASVLSKPTIVASQGETATIRVGDQEPIVTQTLSGNTVTATTEFKPTGMTLEVEPLMVGRDAVKARISAKLSRVSDFRITATSSNLQVVNPVISERLTDTVVTVPDGETLILGGLDQDFDKDTSTGIPILKDLPVIGYLFGSTTKHKEHTEVVFFLTFNIRAPNEARVVTPPAEKDRAGQ